MGSCFSKNNTTPTLPTTSQQQSDLKSNTPQPLNPNNEQQQFIKKEIFVIKHRISHEIDRLPDENGPNLLNPSAVAGNRGGNKVRASSCSKEEVDAILIQCGRLSRSNSAGAENPSRRRRCSGSKRSFDFDLNMGLKNDDDNDGGDGDDDDEGLNHHHRRRHRQQGSRVSSPSSRRSSRERDFRQQRSSSSGGRRISISPSRRRSESPISNGGLGAAVASVNGGAGAAVNGGGSVRPMKMVPVPATDKSNNAAANGGAGEAANGGGSIRPMKMVPVPATNKSNIAGGNTGGEQAGGAGGGVKRIHVKRNVSRSRSPARTNLRIFSDDNSEEHWRQETDTRVADHSSYKRKSLAEIDNNAARSVQPKMADDSKMAAMVENLKLNQNIKSTRIFRRSEDLDMDPSPPSYASLLLEDIHNFHQKNTNSAAATAIQPPFSLPECVSKACSIMEAVADLNSTTAAATAASSTLFSDDRWRKTVVNGGLMEPSLQNYVTMRRGGSGSGSGSATTEEQESSDNNSLTSSQRLNRKSPEPNSANPTTRKCEMNPLEDFQSKLLDRPRKGIGRGRKSAYPMPEITTVALT